MTIDVYRGRKQQHNNNNLFIVTSHQQLGHTNSERIGLNSPLLYWPLYLGILGVLIYKSYMFNYFCFRSGICCKPMVKKKKDRRNKDCTAVVDTRKLYEDIHVVCTCPLKKKKHVMFTAAAPKSTRKIHCTIILKHIDAFIPRETYYR